MLLWACKSQLLHFQESCKSVIKHSLKLARVGAFTSGKLASATSHSSPPPVPTSGCLTFTSLSLDAVLLNSVFLCSKTAQTITSFVISWEMKNDLAEPITCVNRWQGKWNCPFIVWPKLETFTVLCHKRILYIVSICRGWYILLRGLKRRKSYVFLKWNFWHYDSASNVFFTFKKNYNKMLNDSDVNLFLKNLSVP